VIVHEILAETDGPRGSPGPAATRLGNQVF
jgi:hypothetical protein